MQGRSSAALNHGAADVRGHAAPWIERLARLGFAAKGAVYVLVGGLAAAAAVGAGGRTTGSGGALRALSDSTVGQVVLGAIAVGLVGYVLWRAVSAILNPENDGAAARAYYALTAIIYGGLAVEAGRLALGAGGGSSGSEARHWTAELMSQPFGQWLVVAAGAVIAAFGLGQIFKAYTVDLDERLDFGALSREASRWTVRFGRFGLAARGVVFAMIGAFVVVAGVQAQPGEARGVGGALDALRSQPYGPWLLGVVALGLVAYGVYNFVRARYRRLKV